MLKGLPDPSGLKPLARNSIPDRRFGTPCNYRASGLPAGCAPFSPGTSWPLWGCCGLAGDGLPGSGRGALESCLPAAFGLIE
ncbi:hypothetical protein DLM_4245 [Aquitalea magnusonii]|uniref:Uncharacterized protein n=1 Tax=Aquitalea magnusonii TaxID=332411 RepID=A0A3G9GVW3_9NEIS|nr:hypothetical protein DLM_4245 [Aquitalea magnusonii]